MSYSTMVIPSTSEVCVTCVHLCLSDTVCRASTCGGKAPKSMHVSSVMSLLNCIPSASTDRMLRIIEVAKAQVKEDDAGVKKTVGDGLTRGSLCAVLVDNDDGTGDDPSTVWYGFVRRYGVRVGTRC